MKKEPLYKIIINDLKQAILAGKYQVDQQIPTELELSEHYAVSRITSKRALTELENEGLIYRLRGKGSFVQGSASKTKDNQQTDILFIMPFPDDSGLGNYTQGLFQALEGTNYRLVIQAYGQTSQESLPQIAKNYAGVIFYPVNQEADLALLYSLYLNQVPTVILDKATASIDFSAVIADNQQGGYLATKNLLETGLTKVAFISGQPISNTSTVRERYLGYLKALHEAENLEQMLYQPKENLQADNYEETISEFLSQALIDGIQGFVAENDIIAIALVNQLKERGVKIPAEMSIIGFDNIQASELIEPKLTTVKQDFAEIGFVAGRKLIAEIENPKLKRETVMIPVEFIKRETSR